MQRPVRALWRRLGLVLAGSLIGLLAAEVLARLVQPTGNAHLVFNATDAEPRGLWSIDRRLGLELTPGFEGVYAIPGRRVPLHINRLGMRGPDPGELAVTPRWLALGDSFTLALQVPEEQHFLQLLSDGLGVKVHNGGIAGDCTWQSAMRWDHWSHELRPSTVLLVYFLGNDLTDNAAFDRGRIDGALSAGPQPVMEYEPRPPWPVQALLERSFLLAHLRVFLRLREHSGSSEQPLRVAQWRRELEAHSATGRELIQQALPANRDALAWLRDLTRGAGQHLVVALAPPVIAVDQARLAPTFELAGLSPAGADVDAPARAVLGLLDSLAIPACDLTPALRAAQERGVESYLVYDGHWSSEGHAVVAEALQGCLAGVAP